MLTGLEHDAVYGIFVIGQNPCCPPNTVAFRNCQNDTLNILFAEIGVHENSAMILGKPMIATSATKQKSFVFTITCTGRDVTFSSDSMVLAFLIWTEKIAKFCHDILLLATISLIISKRSVDGKKNLTMIR